MTVIRSLNSGLVVSFEVNLFKAVVRTYVLLLFCDLLLKVTRKKRLLCLLASFEKKNCFDSFYLDVWVGQNLVTRIVRRLYLCHRVRRFLYKRHSLHIFTAIFMKFLFFFETNLNIMIWTVIVWKMLTNNIYLPCEDMVKHATVTYKRLSGKLLG